VNVKHIRADKFQVSNRTFGCCLFWQPNVNHTDKRHVQRCLGHGGETSSASGHREIRYFSHCENSLTGLSSFRILNMESASSSERFTTSYQTTRCYRSTDHNFTGLTLHLIPHRPKAPPPQERKTVWFYGKGGGADCGRILNWRRHFCRDSSVRGRYLFSDLHSNH
jgi:hypothetical protein